MAKEEFINAGYTVVGTEDNENKLLSFLKENYPNVIRDTEINIEELKAVLGLPIDEKVNGYGLNFVGRNFARAKYAQKTEKELRLNRSLSVAEMNTQNLVLKGDNLDSLKILKNHYSGQIKCIYIDPPYNTTGDEFVYPDKFDKEEAEVLGVVNLSESDFARMDFSFKTKKSHNGWLSFIYPRLLLAKDLLNKDGVIFISIDDNEHANLKLLCDDVFGEENLVGSFTWKNKYGAGAKTTGFIEVHEYILCYSKNCIKNITSELSTEEEKKYTGRDEHFAVRGGYRTQPLATRSLGDRPNLIYPVIYNDFEIWPNKQWVWSKERMTWEIEQGYVEFTETDGKYSIRSKQYIYDENGEKRRGKPLSILNGPFNQEATFDMRKLFNDKTIFDFSKPEKLIRYLLKMQINDNYDKESIILDFFSGSATSAHAVMQLNAEDSGNRKYIMVQLPEPCGEDTEAYKAGYKNICEIGKERIRRAGEKIKEEAGLMGQDLDVGFKVFKLDSSNLKKWNPDCNDLETSLYDSINNYVAGRTEMDVVYEIMIKMGLDLTYTAKEHTISDKKVYEIGAGALMMCLDDEITTDVAQGMIKLKNELKPEIWKVVFKDNGFASDSNKTNIKEILKCAGLKEEAFTTV